MQREMDLDNCVKEIGKRERFSIPGRIEKNWLCVDEGYSRCNKEKKGRYNKLIVHNTIV